MLSLFNGRPFAPESPRSSPADGPVVLCAPPKLLLQLTPWHRVFFGNLLDAILFRRQQPLQLTSPPSEFWPDVFVNRKLPVRPFWQSVLYHVFIVVVVYGLSTVMLLRAPKVLTQNAFEHSTITYYKVSEYLPPIKAAESEPAKVARKGDPVYARQKIVSLQPNALSRTQTIVAPPSIDLPEDVRVPNIVAWKPVPARMPDTMAVHSGTEMAAATEVVPPAPEVDAAKLRVPPDILARTVVPPAPVAGKLGMEAHDLPLPSAVEPPLSSKNLPSRVGEINIATVAVVPPAPRLPVAEQRASGSMMRAANDSVVPPSPSARGLSMAHDGGANVGRTSSNAVVPPPPAAQGLNADPGVSSRGAGQLIALGIHPAAVTGPLNLPSGNRSGTFAAGPEGKPDAAGTPEIRGGGTRNGPGGNGATPADHSQSAAGISVERGASTPSGDVIVSAPPQSTPPLKPTLLASLAHPTLGDLARGARTQPALSAPPLGIEREVFGPKKFYSMVLNMPNLNSRGGSWIVRFAELKASPEKGELSAPVAMRKVDPAYPSDLMRDRVEGTVVLYAVIHADGSVSDVRVLHGVDSRLDSSARMALAKWQFRPGTKNGTAVDIEAVVQIPFLARPAF